ncbi:MAG: UvrD-helicase domain-containing protein [Pirellulales bacterium]
MTTSMPDRHRGFTEQQRRAVTTRGVSVSLSAGAGCGKTFVLTERFLDHFDPSEVDALDSDRIGQLVAITFTERAAREMRDRIRSRCYDRLLAAAAHDASHWAELLRALDNARISTIHSFCASLLRLRAVEAGVDPQFAVLEKAQADTLLAEAIEDEIRRRGGERDETILELAVRFDLEALGQMVRRLSIECAPEDFEKWLAVSPDEQVARWETCLSELPPELGRQLAASVPAQAVEQVLQANVPTHETMRERRAALLETLVHLRAGPASRDALGRYLDAVISNARVEKAGRGDSWPSQEAYEVFKANATKLRDAAGEMFELLKFDPAAAREAAAIGGQLLALADGVRRAYARRKQELRVMDFDDLLLQAHSLLTDGAHRQLIERLSSSLTLLLVDEFQDTDPLQVQLVEALCGAGLGGQGLERGKLFFVGDYKQSIYRFRGADPHVFRRLRQRTPPEGRQSLSLNFRSQPAILNFVNALFWDDLGENYEPLRPHRPQVSPQPAVEFLWAPADGHDKENVEQLRAREADWIARRIGQLLDGGQRIVWDADAARLGRPAARAARPGDITILLRALTDVEAYEAALRNHRIDYYLVGGHAFYAQQEIFDLLNLLRTLNSPADAVSLIGVLRSGFFSLADETIFWLAQHSGGVSEGLFSDAFPEQINTPQQERAAFAARTIARLRGCKDRLRISELIEMAFELTGYDAALLNEFLGERKLANLLKLQEQARGFQRGDFLGLADFIAQLAQFVAGQPDEPLAATHAEDTNVVRLMSVHQAKGLEFPIVVVPDVNRRRVDSTLRAHFDVRLGPLVRLPAAGDKEPAIGGFDLWRHLEKSEEAAEMNRLLYVATTRAADYLILSGGVNALGEAKGPWAELLARRFDLVSGQFKGRMPEAEVRPIVKVTTEAPATRHASTERRAHVDIEELIAGVENAAAQQERPGPQSIDPIPADQTARRQYSFSRLAGTLHRRFERLDQAEYTGDAPHDPRGLGTLVHAALAAIDLAAPGDCRELVERFAEQHLPDSPAEIEEAVAMVEQFVGTSRTREIAGAKTSHAEVEFLLGWPPDGQTSPDFVLRGFIDRLYQDASDRWHVLDFKTNRTTPAGLAAQAAPYEMQMLLYALAAERILGTPPASLTLHFLRTQGEHEFAWDAAARRRVITLVNDGIKAVGENGVA